MLCAIGLPRSLNRKTYQNARNILLFIGKQNENDFLPKLLNCHIALKIQSYIHHRGAIRSRSRDPLKFR